MPYAPFFEYFPDLAKMETRAITVPDESVFGLPADDYGFIELYCDEPGCDCRRVFFNVISHSNGKDLAVITWGWENRDFYRKWLGSSDRKDIDDLKGPSLNMGSPQSRLAPMLLELAEHVLLADNDYVDRIKRHYSMFREKIDIRPQGDDTFAETRSTLQFVAEKNEKINSYKFHQIVTAMKKEFGSIRKGEEKDHLYDLLPMEEAIVKFDANPAHKGLTDVRVMEAVKLCLFRVRGYLAGVSYDFGKLVEPISIELADYLSKTFDPFIVEEIRVIAEEQFAIAESDGLRRFFELPVKCLLRVYDSVEDRSKMGVRGYLEFISDSIGHKIDLDDERVRFHIRVKV